MSLGGVSERPKVPTLEMSQCLGSPLPWFVHYLMEPASLIAGQGFITKDFGFGWKFSQIARM